MNEGDLLGKIQEMLGSIDGKFNVLEEQIDIDVQIRYFEMSGEVKKTLDSAEILNQSENLFDESISTDQKKKLLVGLASVDKAEAFRILERYNQSPDPDLKEAIDYVLANAASKKRKPRNTYGGA